MRSRSGVRPKGREGRGTQIQRCRATDRSLATEYVILGWGANDLRRGGWDAESQILEPIMSAVDGLLNEGFAPVLWVPNAQYNPPHTQDAPYELVDRRISEIVRPGLQAIADLEGLLVIDTFDLFGLDPGPLYKDHVHPSDTGNDLLADYVVTVVSEPDRVESSIWALISAAAVTACRNRLSVNGRLRVRPSSSVAARCFAD